MREHDKFPSAKEIIIKAFRKTESCKCAGERIRTSGLLNPIQAENEENQGLVGLHSVVVKSDFSGDHLMDFAMVFRFCGVTD